jgi:DNA-binding response OmpR family regulator
VTTRLLLVEDDDAVADVVVLHLAQAGFDAVERIADGGVAARAIGTRAWDLVLLDLMLPGTDGWDLMRALRRDQPLLPVLILSARAAETDRVLGLELGADDYLAKPFSMREMVARVRALLRRAELARHAAPALLPVGRMRLDTARRVLVAGSREVALTLREFDLLAFLARHPREVFSRTALLDRVWGAGFEGYEHTVNSHINRLRRKVEDDPQDPRLIRTVWGVGYRFDDTPDGVPSAAAPAP